MGSDAAASQLADGFHGQFIHDPAAVYAAMDPEAFEWEEAVVRVLPADSIARGHSMMHRKVWCWSEAAGYHLDRKGFSEEADHGWAGRAAVKVAVGVQRDPVLQAIRTLLLAETPPAGPTDGLRGLGGSPKSLFAPFELPSEFALDQKDLKRRYQRLQMIFHPDQFANNPPHEQVAAAAESTRVNDAFAVLSNDLRRAEYLLELHGSPITDGDTHVDPELLMETLEMREAIEDAQLAGDTAELAVNHATLVERYEATVAEVAAAWESPVDLNSARVATVQLKYVRRAMDELEEVLPKI